MPPCRDELARVLLVEGKNDCHVVLALRQKRNLEGRFGIYECGSDEQTIARMNALILSAGPPRPEIIGVVLDADTPKFIDRWNQLRDRLLLRGYACPAQPLPQGTVLHGPEGSPTVGIWLMPDNQNVGMLEDFLLHGLGPRPMLVTRTAVLLARATRIATFKPAHLSKALIHSYLAWQDEPGRPLGQSVTARVLGRNSSLLDIFVDWLEVLFPA